MGTANIRVTTSFSFALGLSEEQQSSLASVRDPLWPHGRTLMEAPSHSSDQLQAQTPRSHLETSILVRPPPGLAAPPPPASPDLCRPLSTALGSLCSQDKDAVFPEAGVRMALRCDAASHAGPPVPSLPQGAPCVLNAVMTPGPRLLCHKPEHHRLLTLGPRLNGPPACQDTALFPAFWGQCPAPLPSGPLQHVGTFSLWAVAGKPGAQESRPRVCEGRGASVR